MMKKAGGWCGIALVSLFAIGIWMLPASVNAGPAARRAGQAPSVKPVDKPEEKAGLAQLREFPTDKEVESQPEFVENRAAFLTYTADIAPYNSWDLRGDSSNDVLAIDLATLLGFAPGTSLTMTGVAWDVIINTLAPGRGSYQSEARMYFDDNVAPDAIGLFLTPGVGVNSVGVGHFASVGILDLSDNGIPDIVLPNGVLRLELYESYDDSANNIDANYDSPSTVTIQVMDPTTTGACCENLTAVCAGTMTQAACTSVSGRTWFADQSCPGYACPVPVFGNNCGAPISVSVPSGLPYTDPNQTNCGRVNDYSNTCLGSYDGGEDIIYQLNVASATCVNLSLTSNATWVGMAIDPACPLNTTTCTAKATSSGPNVAINSLNLSAGTYYIMIDTWPTPNCIPSFTLNISQCPQTGACCHSNGTCTDVFAAACNASGDIFKGSGTACLTSACPPVNDQCASATNISAVPYSQSNISMPGATDDSNVNPSCDSSSSCGTGPANNGVWFTYTPTQDCRASLSQSGIDAATSIWTGANCTSLTQATCSDPETFTYLMTSGVQYWILISNWSCSSNPTANSTFNFDCQPPPPPPVNDKCPGTKISCGETLAGTTAEAINDYDDTGICASGYNQPGRDVAYELDLLVDSTVTITLDPTSSWDPAFYVLADCSTPTACLFGVDDGFSGDTETASYTLAAGTYYIIVDTYSSSSLGGTFNLSIDCVALPVGACCTNGGCIEDTSLGCAEVGGVYAGDNTTCSGSSGGDCNSNGLIDKCDLVNGMADCQPNGIPDVCDVPPIGSGADCQQDGIPDECQLAGNKAIVLSEGFEGSVPPAGWTAVVANPFTWEVDTYAPYEGAQNATCFYDETYSGTQDEWIISPQLVMSGPVTLSGYSNGSIYWGITPYQNYDLEAWIVIGPNVNDSDDILLGKIDEETWAVTWQWAPFTYNFTAPATPFRIGFRYYGFDGAQAGLDAITVDGNAGPLPNDCNENQVPDECDSPVCGNNCLEGGVGSTAEECDGTEDAACPGECYPAGGPNACRCPFCGDGVVNPGEDCDGGICCTPNCTFKPSSEVCRAAAGICDAVESCTGSSSDCPADGFLHTVCRASTGPCDPAEICQGTGPNCPPEIVIGECIHGDGCCPGSYCNTNIDDDCPPVCGNNVTEPGEQCDGTDDGGCFYGLGCLADCTCEDRIPTVSTWGLVVLTLLLLTGAKLYFSRRTEGAVG